MGTLPSGAGALVGKRLGNYELVALLALGGTAEIYLARISGTAGFEKYVVVKCLHDHLADDREFVQMFLDEARIGALLGHSNIVQTLGLGEHEGRYYMVMEYISGMSMALLSRRATERVAGGRIPVSLVVGAMTQACAGLHYAHDCSNNGRPLNLIHRDVSPQNLVITFEGVVKVVDFGIAKAEERETATRSGTIKGKFAYMSPEQCQAREIDRRTDVFALGVVLHELLTGRRLFKRNSPYETYQAILECAVPSPSSVNHELDPALDPVVMKALAKNPSQRYPTAEAFGEAMAHYLHSRGKAGGPGDIARFIDQYYALEIGDSGARMRDLLAGRPAAALGWDDPDEPGSASAVELSQFEVVEDSHSGGAPLDPPRRRVSEADADDAREGGTDDDEFPSEATRIELNPTSQLAELDAEVRRARPTPPSSQRPAPAPPHRPPPAPPMPGPRRRPSTAPPVPAPRRPATAPPVAGPPRRPVTAPPVAIPEVPTQPVLPRMPGPTTPPRMATPLFGMATPGGSMFGGPPGGLRAAPLPSAPEPERPEIPSIFGGPSKLAPKSAAGAPRARSVTEPAPIPGVPTPRPFGPAAVIPTMLAEPESTPRSKSFASAPEAKTMAMNDGGFVADAIAQIRAAEARMQPSVPAEDADGPTFMDPALMAPRPSAVPPGRGGFPAPMIATMLVEPAVDPARAGAAPQMNTMLALDPSPVPAPSSWPTSSSPSSWSPAPAAAPYGAPLVDPLGRGFAPGPMPSGESSPLAHGTPSGAYVSTEMPSHDMMLPTHLIGLPPIDTYPRYATVPMRLRVAWILPVAIGSVLAVLVGVIAAIAT